MRPLIPQLVLFLIAGATSVRAAMPEPDADDGGLTLPAGFRALVVADDLMDGRRGDHLRFIAVAPDGVVYAKTQEAGILALKDADGDGRLEEKREFGSGGGTDIAIQGDWLYHSTNSAIYRYARRAGELVPADEPQLIVKGLPDRRSHSAKCFAFDGQGRLLVEVGSPYNVYSEPDRQRGARGRDATEFLKTFGGFWRFDPDREEQTQADGFHYSTGHRHVLAVDWQPVAKTFFVVMMGRDNLNVVAPEHYNDYDNAERVAEEMHRFDEGANLGWPYTYWDPIRKARMVAPEFGGDNRKLAESGRYPEPVVAFPAHWAPLQMTFYVGSQFPAHYRGGAFVAFHGSWNRAPLPQDGYNIAFVPFDKSGTPSGGYEVFAANAGPRRFRMGGVAVGPDGSLYVSETDRGRVWRIFHTGEGPAAAETVGDSSAKPAAGEGASKVAKGGQGTGGPAGTAAINTRGKRVYDQYCATCHMPDGSGAGKLQPALINNAVVGGNPAQLVDVIVRGPTAALPADRPKYSNIMPPFPFLSDAQVADVVTYMRQVFADNAPGVSSAEVRTMRRKKP